jgi:hypothetical protein
MAEADVIDTTEQTTEAPEKPQIDIEAARKQWQDSTEEKARKEGWRPLEEYLAERGDPAGWRSADAYLLFKDMRGTIRRKEEDFERQIAGVNTLMQASLAAQRSELDSRRDAAIEAGDKVAVKSLDKQIDKLQAPVQQTQPGKDPLVIAWENANSWINEPGDKAEAANFAFSLALSKGKDVRTALADVDKHVKALFPDAKAPPRQTTVPESERGRGSAGFSKKPAAVTMDTLSEEERKIWGHSAHMWKNDPKAFLESVANIRKAQEKA